MKRLYHDFILNHFKKYDKMLFIMGPRQIGKTTAAKNTGIEDDFYYFNWDDSEDRGKIIQGTKEIANTVGLPGEAAKTKIIVFDEIHKYGKWKTFIKGFYDKYHTPDTKIIVTGSARLDTYRKGGDSLMGRYFKLRMHQFSVGELLDPSLRDSGIRGNSEPISQDLYDRLLTYGGFPEPLSKSDSQFYTLWRSNRDQQLFREDVRDIANVKEISQIEVLAEFIRLQVGQLVSYTSFANKVNISIETVKRWITILKSLYYCFEIRPWSTNISRSLIKEPKLFVWDWSLIDDVGSKHENFIASHLMKAIHYWEDRGFGKYGLYFLRTKDKREVDFLVVKDNQPWFLVEVKTSDTKELSKNLEYFQKKTGAKHAFQVICNLDYRSLNCFDYTHPIIVPAKTFLSQLA